MSKVVEIKKLVDKFELNGHYYFKLETGERAEVSKELFNMKKVGDNVTATYIVNDAAQQKFDSMVTWLAKLYDNELGQFLAARMAKYMRKHKDDNIADVRVCDLGDPKQVAAYNFIVQNQCCGSFDFEVTHYKSGRRFRLGFSYGH